MYLLFKGVVQHGQNRKEGVQTRPKFDVGDAVYIIRYFIQTFYSRYPRDRHSALPHVMSTVSLHYRVRTHPIRSAYAKKMAMPSSSPFPSDGGERETKLRPFV